MVEFGLGEHRDASKLASRSRSPQTRPSPQQTLNSPIVQHKSHESPVAPSRRDLSRISAHEPTKSSPLTSKSELSDEHEMQKSTEKPQLNNTRHSAGEQHGSDYPFSSADIESK